MNPFLLPSLAACLGAIAAALGTLLWCRHVALKERHAHLDELATLRESHAERASRLQADNAKELADLRAAHHDQLKVIQEDAKLDLAAAEARFEKRLKEQGESALSVTVHPFVDTMVDKGFLSSETKVEVGYKYQLFVNGLPCFEPHAVVIETTTHKKLNEETIELLKGKAVEAAQAAVQLKSGGVATKFISFAKTAVRLAK